MDKKPNVGGTPAKDRSNNILVTEKNFKLPNFLKSFNEIKKLVSNINIKEKKAKFKNKYVIMLRYIILILNSYDKYKKKYT